MNKALLNLRRSFASSLCLSLLVISALLWLAPIRVQAAIPAAALADPMYGLGYLVVSYYPGVTTNGTGDCTAGIQQALADAYAVNANFQNFVYKDTYTNLGRPLAVFFPPGTYQITNILECYAWEATNKNQPNGLYRLVGSTATNRPVIKLAPSAVKYQDTNDLRQMISFRLFQGGNGTPQPVPHPLSQGGVPSGGYVDQSGNFFFQELRNIDFDCNGNVAAVGVTFSATQQNSIENVKVTATGAFAGFVGIPGAGSCCANIEVEGAQYGILNGGYSALHVSGVGSAGGVIAGLKLQNQTMAAGMFEDFTPMTIVGFQITNSKSMFGTDVANYSTASGSMTLLDGQIGINSATNLVAIDNSYGKDFYVRNVYVTGTTNLIKSSNSITTGSGTWSQIVEYVYTNPKDVSGVPPNSSYTLNTTQLESYSLIDGNVKDHTVNLAITNIVKNSSAPPTDLVSRHLWASFPSFNGDTNLQHTVVVNTNLGFNNANDATVVLQAAIDAATNSPYNGRVFLPSGLYNTTNTLTLHSNTVLMGVGWQSTYIRAGNAWKPLSEVPMIQTDDSAAATTQLAWLSVAPRILTSQSDTNYDRFNLVDWQAGGSSVCLCVEPVEAFTFYPTNNPGGVRSELKYTGNGGGKWYTLGMAGEQDNGDPHYRKVKISGTSQPLWFYGFNLEHGLSDMECEVSGASNVRLLGMKQEGDRPIVVVSNSTNIAIYSTGRNHEISFGGDGHGLFQVLGSSTNILMGNIEVQFDFQQPNMSNNIIYEAITGAANNTNVLWPNMVSVYKRGNITDMYGTNGGGGSPPAAPTGLAATPISSSEIDLSWNSVANILSYNAKNSTVTGGPYTTFASPPSGTTTADNTGLIPGTTYYYVVTAVNANGESANSTQASAQTTANAAPTLDALGNLNINENVGQQTVNLTGITDGTGDTGQNLTVTASSDNTGLIPNPSVDYTPNATTGDIKFTPVANATGTANVTVHVQDDGGTAGGGVNTFSRSFGVTVNDTNIVVNHTIMQTSKAPAIDGTVDAIWNTANVAAITNVSSGSISGASDCSGNFRTLWDTTNLYVLVQVTDDVAVHDCGTSLYDDDSVEIYLDANNTRTTNYQANDFHFDIGLNGASQLVQELAHNATTGVVATYVTNSLNGNYVVEVKIPWSTLGQSSVAAGAFVGLDVQIDDNDVAGAHTRNAELQWHDNADKDYQNPSAFGTAKLESVTADVALVQTPTAPTIDGTVDAIWSTAYTSAITNISFGVISSSADCSGTFQTLWDATNLYMLVQVTDDVAVHDCGTSLYNDDTVEIFLDANNKKDTNYQAGDFHYDIGLNGASQLIQELAHNATTGVVATYLTNSLNGNYVVEVKFPWTTLGQTNLTSDSLLGLDVQIDDNDVAGAHARDGELEWHDNANLDYQNPSKFGTGRLAPKP